ncbi:MAG TPA: hypothetical protein VEH75_03865 [Xanthobacteraceae bacterium]|nr:hypothetical protein [Xanthobacteraceae bacterium]
MPPVFLWVLGAIGAALAAKLLAEAGRKANRDLEEVRASANEDRAKIPTLERDPQSGQYRPPKS